MRKLALIVEDDRDFQLLARHAMLNAGFQVILVENGEQGLSYIAQNRPPNIVISDVQMPFVTGLEMLAELRRRPATVHLPVMMVSSDSAGRPEAMRLGAGAFVMKGDCSLIALLVSHALRLLCETPRRPA